MSLYLIFDVGNTRLKWARFDGAQPGATLLEHGAVFLEHAAAGAQARAKPSAEDEKALEDIEAEAQRRWPLDCSLIIHRYGRLEPGEDIVLVITASAHREAAFEACHFLIDWLKTKAPFWKLEETPRGQHWIEPRTGDDEVELGSRQIQIALRRLRRFARQGAATELDLPGTIRSTAANAGWLDLRWVPERAAMKPDAADYQAGAAGARPGGCGAAARGAPAPPASPPARRRAAPRPSAAGPPR